MKLELSINGKVITVQTQRDSLTIEEYFEIFKGLLVSAGFSEKTIDDYIIQLADEMTI